MAKGQEMETRGGNAAEMFKMPSFTDEELRSVSDLSSAIDFLESKFGVGAVRRAEDEIGTGFILADDTVKDQLVGSPMVLLGWAFRPGDFGEFVTIYLMTEDGRKVILNDGSTGICSQLADYTARTQQQTGLLLRHGLRKSTYRLSTETSRPVPRDFEGPTVPASTFYLDTSA